MINSTLLLLVFFITLLSISQNKLTEYIILITFDTLSWQELFGGADSLLINDSIYTTDRKEAKKRYWAETVEERRKKLFPFIWNTVATQGQLYGNRHHDN